MQTADGPAVWVCCLRNKQARCVMGHARSFGFRGRPSAGRPGFGEAHGESCLLVCLLSALPSSDGSSQREGELSALFTSPFPVSTLYLAHPGCAVNTSCLKERDPNKIVQG